MLCLTPLVVQSNLLVVPYVHSLLIDISSALKYTSPFLLLTISASSAIRVVTAATTTNIYSHNKNPDRPSAQPPPPPFAHTPHAVTARSIAFLSAPDVDELPEAESNKVRDALMRNLSAVATNRRNLISACEESQSAHDSL
jgi:hypothetical protein